MPKITINQDRCKGCLLCLNFCPKQVIIIDNKLNRQGIKPIKSKENAECLGCALCAIICPDCCIEVYK